MTQEAINQYSVMLVDDEEDVAKTIINKINWDALGFTVQGYAHNGLEALEQAEEHQPDVVMTDIKMPYMDGLELSRRLKKQYPSVKIIIFSGFDEFEYAKEAIRIEAEEYILKPIDAGELSDLFKRIHQALDQEFSEKQNINKLKHYYMDSLPILQENFYTSLIEGRVSEQTLQREMMDYQVSLDGPFYSVVVIHNSQSLSPAGINPLLITMSVRKLAEEQLARKWNARFFSYLGNVIMIAQLRTEAEITELTDDCEVLSGLAKHVAGATISVGIGKVVSEIRKLPLSYGGAREAISYRVIYGRGKAINITEIAPEDHTGEDVSRDWDQYFLSIVKSIKVDGAEEVKAAVSAFIAACAPKNPSIQDYHFFVMDLVSELHKLLKASQLDADLIFGRESDLYQKVTRMDLTELAHWLEATALKIREAMNENRISSTRSIVMRAEDYVHEHYGDQNLSVEQICGYLGVSSAYFSTIFKRETGKTFINFLTDYRMEQALRMLLDEEQKTYVIAEAVGYSDPNYFSYAFKKKFGMSPSKYKAQKS